MTPPASRHRRNRSIQSAVVTSLISKGTTIVLQFVSLPLAARILGREEFGIYATISMAVFMVAILEIGIGPALGRGLSEASAKGDREKEGRLYVSGVTLLAALTLIGCLLAAIVISTLPIPILFGAEYEPFVDVMRPALWIGIFLMAGQVAVEMTDRVREGYMESHIVNAWGAAGNLGGAIAILAGIHFQPTVSFLLLAVFAPNLIARGISTALLLRKRPWLVARDARPDRSTMVELIGDGLSFSATSFVVYLVEYSVCALIVGRISGPGEVAIFHVLIAITTSFTGMLVMVGRPTWAAVVDAATAGDHHWLRTATRRYYQYLAVLTAATAALLVVAGPWVIPLIYGSEFEADRLLFAGHACFLLAIGWRRVNLYLLIGLGLLRRAVAPILTGLAIGLTIGTVGLHQWGLPALFAGMAIGTLFVPGVLLPQLVRSALLTSEEGRGKKAATIV